VNTVGVWTQKSWRIVKMKMNKMKREIRIPMRAVGVSIYLIPGVF